MSSQAEKSSLLSTCDLTKWFKQAKRYAKAMRASLIFSSTSHSINVQKVWTYSTCHITQLTNLIRFSKSSSAKPLTSNALFLRLKISANRFYCTNLYSRPLGDSRQYRNGLMMYVERCHALMINPSTTISPLCQKIFLNTSCSMRRHNPASNVGKFGLLPWSPSAISALHQPYNIALLEGVRWGELFTFSSRVSFSLIVYFPPFGRGEPESSLTLAFSLHFS